MIVQRVKLEKKSLTDAVSRFDNEKNLVETRN